MPNIITLTLNNGDKLVCNRQCYDSRAWHVTCICDNQNTGVGLDTALRFNKEYMDHLVRTLFGRYCTAMKIDIMTGKYPHHIKKFRFTNPNPFLYPVPPNTPTE